MLTDREAKQQIVQIVNELFAMGLLTATGSSGMEGVASGP